MKPSEISDYYIRLGVSRSASEEELKKAYRTLAQQWHPDHNSGREAESRIEFIAVSEAYKELSPEAQKVYNELPNSNGDDFLRFYEEITRAMDKVSPGLGTALNMFAGAGLSPAMRMILGDMFKKK